MSSSTPLRKAALSSSNAKAPISSSKPTHKPSANTPKAAGPASSSKSPNTPSHPKSSAPPAASTPKSTKKNGKDKGRLRDISGPSNLSTGVQEGEGSGEGVESAGPEAWGVSLVVGSTVPRLPPVFTKNAEHFFLANNNTIRVHSASTSQPISTLSIGQDAHTAAITAYTLNPSNPLQLVTSSLDGSLKVWDYLDGSLVRTINLPGPVTHIVAGQEGSWYAATNSKGGKQYSTTKGIQSTIWKVDFSLPKPSTDSSKSSRSSHTKIQRIRPCSGLLLSSSGSFLVALGEKKAYCIRTSDLTIGFTKFVSPNLLTCGAFHPTENWFATGDSQGLVRLWYCLSDVAQSAVGRGAGGEQERMVDVEKARRTPTQTLHWHAHAVSAVAFNAAGTSVLSVGQEATLVVWSVATGGKEFAPRLGGPLISVASRPPGEAREEESWVGLDDGSVKKVGGDGRGGRTIKGGFECSRIEPSPAPSLSTATPLAYHSQTSTVLLPSSHPSSLQFFSPTLQSALLELEVSPSNRVSATDEKIVDPARVERAVFSTPSNGVGGASDWMATSEMRDADEEEGGAEERMLKVWRWDQLAKTYILTTRLANPHTSPISSITFSPTPLQIFPTEKQPLTMLVSTDVAGTARLWREKRIRYKGGRIEAFFVPHTLFSHRSLPIYDSAWSPDGAVLALAQGSVVTLWDPASSTLRGTLACSEFGKGEVRKVEFVGKDGRWIIGAGQKKGLVAWDLVNGSVLWALPNQTVDHLVPHAGTPSFTIAESSASASTTFSVFSVQSPIPVRQRVVPQTIRSIASYPIAPSTEPSTSFAPSVEDAPIALLVVTPSWDVLLIGDKETLPSLTSSSDATQSLATASSDAPSSARTLFDEIFGTSSAPPTAAAARPISAPKTYKSLGELFEGSAMVLPDMSMIYEEVLEGVLDLRKDSEDDEQDERADGEMELDEVEMGGNAERDSMGSVRKVGDAEVVRLEGLFRELFGAAPSTSNPSPPKPNGIPPKATNGISKSSNTPRRSLNGNTSRPPSSSTSRKTSTPLAGKPSPSNTSPSSTSNAMDQDTPQSGRKRKNKD